LSFINAGYDIGHVAVGGAELLTDSQVERIASRREMLIEILNYRRFISGDSFS
jgi:hypothetical protein